MTWRRRLKIQKQDSSASDGTGGFTNSWTDVETIRGGVKPISKSRNVNFGREITDELYEIKFRYLSVKDHFDNEAKWQIVEQSGEGRTFRVHSRENRGDRDRFAKIICSEVK